MNEELEFIKKTTVISFTGSVCLWGGAFLATWDAEQSTVVAIGGLLFSLAFSYTMLADMIIERDTLVSNSWLLGG